MKIRTSFVANSSSCSFTISREGLSNKTIDRILTHMEYAKLKRWRSLGLYDDSFMFDGWKVTLSKDKIQVDTSMDNFDLYHFVRRLGVPRDHITEFYHSNWGEELPPEEGPNVEIFHKMYGVKRHENKKKFRRK